MALQARVPIRNKNICSNATDKINRLQKKRWKVKQKHALTIKVKCWNAKGIFDYNPFLINIKVNLFISVNNFFGTIKGCLC